MPESILVQNLAAGKKQPLDSNIEIGKMIIKGKKNTVRYFVRGLFKDGRKGQVYISEDRYKELKSNASSMNIKDVGTTYKERKEKKKRSKKRTSKKKTENGTPSKKKWASIK